MTLKPSGPGLEEDLLVVCVRGGGGGEGSEFAFGDITPGWPFKF